MKVQRSVGSGRILLGSNVAGGWGGSFVKVVRMRMCMFNKACGNFPCSPLDGGPV